MAIHGNFYQWFLDQNSSPELYPGTIQMKLTICLLPILFRDIQSEQLIKMPGNKIAIFQRKPDQFRIRRSSPGFCFNVHLSIIGKLQIRMDKGRDLILIDEVRRSGSPLSAVSAKKNVRTGFAPLDNVSPLPLKCVMDNRRIYLK